MSVIWRYSLRLVNEQEIDLPGHVSPLSVQIQNDEIVLWAIVNPGSQKYHRKVFIVGTGHALPDVVLHPYTKYVGTVQQGALVWHVFLGM